MEARVGTLAVGTRIVTLLTGRQGTVREQRGDETVVGFADRPITVAIHSHVRVGVVETLH